MTLSEVIAKVMQLRPSEFDKDDLTRWLNEVEFLAYDQVISRADIHPPEMPKPVFTVTPEPVSEDGPTEIIDDELVDADEDTEEEAEEETEEKNIPPAAPDFKYRPYDYSIDAEKVLLIPDQFSSAYMTYLFAKQDFFLGEIDRYNMEALQFETEFQQFAKWFRRTYRPKEVRHEITNHRPGPFPNRNYHRYVPGTEPKPHMY